MQPPSWSLDFSSYHCFRTPAKMLRISTDHNYGRSCRRKTLRKAIESLPKSGGSSRVLNGRTTHSNRNNRNTSQTRNNNNNNNNNIHSNTNNSHNNRVNSNNTNTAIITVRFVPWFWETTTCFSEPPSFTWVPWPERDRLSRQTYHVRPGAVAADPQSPAKNIPAFGVQALVLAEGNLKLDD